MITKMWGSTGKPVWVTDGTWKSDVECHLEEIDYKLKRILDKLNKLENIFG